MKLEQQVTGLELSKKLKKAGYKQDGLFWWVTYSDNTTKLIYYNSEEFTWDENKRRCVAPTVAELGEALPDNYYSQKCFNPRPPRWVCYAAGTARPYFTADTEANARASMWLYLKKEGLLK